MDNGLVQLALVFLGLAAIALLIVIGSDSRLWRGIGRKAGQPAPPPAEPTRSKPTDAPLPAEPIRSKPATHTTQPLRPTHKPSPFIDDLAEQIQYFDALLPQVATAIDALPRTLDDCLRLRADVDEIRWLLNSARNALHSTDPQVRLPHAQKLRTARLRLEAIQHSAITLANEVHRLAELQPRLLTEARAVVAALTTVEQAAVMPVQLPRHAPIVRAATWEIQRLAERQPSGPSDEMRKRHNRLLGLERDIIAGRTAINHVDALRTTLLDLLGQPELAIDPAWHRAIGALCRIRQTSDDPARMQRLAALHTSADELKRRLHLLHDGALHAQVPLDESRLLALVAEARTIQDAVRTLWQRARAVNPVPKPEAEQGVVS